MKILFRPITLDAQTDIIRYTRVGAYRNCDFSFANMYSWQFLYRTEYAVVEDTLFVRFYIDGGRPAYMMPQGSLPLRESIAWLVDDAASLGHTLCLLGVSEESRSALNIVWPEAFRFVAERDYADYIYLRDDLASLAGKRLQPKRNHVNRFIKNNPDYCYRPLTAELVPVCLQFEKRWISEKRAGHDEDLAAEREAMTRALTHFDELGLSGGTRPYDSRVIPLCQPRRRPRSVRPQAGKTLIPPVAFAGEDGRLFYRGETHCGGDFPVAWRRAGRLACLASGP